MSLVLNTLYSSLLYFPYWSIFNLILSRTLSSFFSIKNWSSFTFTHLLAREYESSPFRLYSLMIYSTTYVGQSKLIIHCLVFISFNSIFSTWHRIFLFIIYLYIYFIFLSSSLPSFCFIINIVYLNLLDPYPSMLIFPGLGFKFSGV